MNNNEELSISGIFSSKGFPSNIKTFINDYVENPNAKIRGILQDLPNDGIPIVSNIRAIAILSSIVTESFWRFINDNSTNHFDLHQ
jgi:hypothetical protein